MTISAAIPPEARTIVLASASRVAHWTLLRHPLGLVGCGFGAGLSEYAPGTVGSAVGVLLYWPVSGWSWPWQLGLVGIAAPVGVLAGDHVIRVLGKEDPPQFVFDEIVGQWLVLIVVPPTWSCWLLAFLLFRAIDVAKPWPVSLLDRKLKGGFGAMADDVAAGLIAAALCAGLLMLGPVIDVP